MEFPRQGVGCHFLLQGIFLTQGLNLCLLHLLHWQAGSILLNHQGSALKVWVRLSVDAWSSRHVPSFSIRAVASSFLPPNQL